MESEEEKDGATVYVIGIKHERGSRRSPTDELTQSPSYVRTNTY